MNATQLRQYYAENDALADLVSAYFLMKYKVHLAERRCGMIAYHARRRHDETLLPKVVCLAEIAQDYYQCFHSDLVSNGDNNARI